MKDEQFENEFDSCKKKIRKIKVSCICLKMS